MHFLDKDGPPKHEKQVDSFQWIFSYFFLSLQEIPFFLDLRRWSLQNWPSYHNCALLCFAGFSELLGLFTLELLKHIKLFLTEFPTLSYWDHWVLLRAAAPHIVRKAGKKFKKCRKFNVLDLYEIDMGGPYAPSVPCTVHKNDFYSLVWL